MVQLDQSIQRKLCLINEVESSINFIKRGMAELQKLNQGNDFFEGPIFSLSFGIEKLLKSVIVMAHWDNFDELHRIHKNRWRSSKGHNLDSLLTSVTAIVEEKNYSSKIPVGKEDIEFITKNPDLNKLIAVLSKFSQGGRYYNLDIIMKGASDFSDPRSGWQELENVIFSRRGDLQQKLADDLTFDHMNEVIHEIVVILERFLRAVARFFTLAGIGPVAKQMGPQVYDFLMLREEDIGKRDYNNFQRYPKQPN